MTEALIRPYVDADERAWIECRVLAFLDSAYFDAVEREKEHYKRTRIYPIMHLVAIRKQVYEKYPFVATSLYNAFCESKKIALEKMFNLRALRYMTPFLMRDIDEIYEFFDGDPWPYGVEPNRPTLEAFVTYLTDQSLIAAPVPVDDLFVPTH